MLTPQEFMEIVMKNPDYQKAAEILKKEGLQFLRCSINNTVIKRVINDVNKTEILDAIKEANRLEIDINEILESKTRNSKAKEGLEKFFAAVENKSHKYRLYILAGETGVGKTTIAIEKFPNAPVNNMTKDLDPYSLCYTLRDNGNGLAPHETPFLKAVKNGGIVILDEINGAAHDTLMLLQGLTDNKDKIVIGNEVIKIHDNFKILATMNPPSETDERTPLGDALLGRACGFVMELTDDIICKRLGVRQAWLNAVRQLHTHVRNSGLVDVRDINYRDFQKLSDPYLDFDETLKFSFCVNYAANLSNYKRIQETGEFKKLLAIIEQNSSI